MSEAIRIDGLTKSYGNHTVLRGLTFHVAKGETCALLGVNGAGKTTALECIEGIRKPDSGKVMLNGTTGIQLQSASLPAHIKPMEAVRLFAKWKHAKANPAMLAALGISDFQKKQYAHLSTGQKRRLHLALALIGDPDILFLDEPTAGLDVESRASLHRQLRTLKAQGKTIVFASHDMAEVESLCDQIAILKEGRLVFWGNAAQAAAKLGSHYHIHIQTASGDLSLTAVNIGETLLAALEDLKQKNIAVEDIKIDRGSLEELFLHIAEEG